MTPTNVTTACYLAATQAETSSHGLAFLEEQPLPPLKTPTQVRIRVAYTDVNPVDVQKMQQHAKQQQQQSSEPFVVGYGGSGHLDVLGENVPGCFQVGQPVAFLGDASQRLGSYGTHVCVDYRLVAPISESNVEMEQAASIGVAGNTAYEALEKVGLNLSEQDDNKTNTLLIVGGAGGVGSWTTRLARALYPNLNIVVTSSTPEDPSTVNWCVQENGANHVIGHDAIATALTAGRSGSVAHIVCLMEPTPSLMSAMADVLTPFGQICLVVAGPSIGSLDLGFVFFKSGSIHMETVFSNARNQFGPLDQAAQMTHMMKLMETGKLKAPLRPDYHSIPGCLDWKDALDAGGVWETMAGNLQSNTTKSASNLSARGKLVMKIS